MELPNSCEQLSPPTSCLLPDASLEEQHFRNVALSAKAPEEYAGKRDTAVDIEATRCDARPSGNAQKSRSAQILHNVTDNYGWDSSTGLYMDGQSTYVYESGCLSPLVASSNPTRKNSPLSVAVSRPAGEWCSVQRMWEGRICDVLEDSDIAIQTACMPCVTFGKNMQRAGFGTCFVQGAMYFMLAAATCCSYILFIFSGVQIYLYLALGLLITTAAYVGHHRVQIRKRFNISGSNEDEGLKVFDDHLHHLLCGCCTMCQEARTLQVNNVQNGVWHGPSYTLAVGSNCQSPSDLVPCHESKSSGTPGIETDDSISNSGSILNHPWSPQAAQFVPLIEEL